MNREKELRMNTNEAGDTRQSATPSRDSSAAEISTPPAGSGGGGRDYVFSVFRQDDTPVRKLIWTALVMQILFFIVPFLIAYQLHPPVPDIIILAEAAAVALVALALPYVPGIIVRRPFRDVVIPMCSRYTYSEKEIVSGALQSLRFLCFHYILSLSPGILILFRFFEPVSKGKYSYSGGTGLYILGISVFLLGEYAQAVFPVAWMFSRRAGMIVMIPFIILGQIVLIMNYLARITGFLYDVPKEKYISDSIFIFAVCAILFGGAIAYFTHAAKKDAEEYGLTYF